MNLKLPLKQNVVNHLQDLQNFVNETDFIFSTYFCESKTSQDIHAILWVIITKFMGDSSVKS